MQKHVNLVDLVKSFPTNIYLQNLASIQKRASPVKFARLAEKSRKGSISNLSTKVLRARNLTLNDSPVALHGSDALQLCERCVFGYATAKDLLHSASLALPLVLRRRPLLGSVALSPDCPFIPCATSAPPADVTICTQPLYNVDRAESLWPGVIADWVRYH